MGDKSNAGKGDRPRKVNRTKWDSNWDDINWGLKRRHQEQRLSKLLEEALKPQSDDNFLSRIKEP
jgi:hypothetical protein